MPPKPPKSPRRTRSTTRAQKDTPAADLNDSIELSDTSLEGKDKSPERIDRMASTDAEVVGSKSELAQILKAMNNLTSEVKDLNTKFDNMHTIIFNPIEGIQPRLEGVITDSEDHRDRIEALEEENSILRRDVDILTGLAQKQSREIKGLRLKIDDQATRSMQENVVISGILVAEGTKEFKPIVIDFLTETLGVEDVDAKDIFKAHQMGNSIVIRVQWNLKERIMAKVYEGVLKGKKNSKKVPYFVSEQFPESINEARRQAKRDSQALKDKYEKDFKDNPTHKPKVSIKKNQVYVNNDLQKPLVVPPEPVELFPNAKEQKKIDGITVKETGPQGEKGSTFWGAVVKVSNAPEVRRSYVKMRQMHPDATHIMLAYKFTQNGQDFYGYQDDREFGGSYKIAEAIDNKNATGIAVFVCRKFGGVHIGKKRWEHISFCANEALGMAGF